MTADREKLREELAQALYAYDENARNRLSPMPWASETEVRRRPYLARAEIAIAGPLTPILAQADTAERMEAERDEARRSYRSLLWEMERGGRVTSVYPQETYRQRVEEADERTRAAQADIARLSAEVGALRQQRDAAEESAARYYREAERAREAAREAAEEAYDCGLRDGCGREG